MYKSYLISDDTDKRTILNKSVEGFYTSKDKKLTNETILIVNFISIFIFTLTILCLIDTVMVESWSPWTLAIMVFLLCIPVIGDFLGLFIIVNWFINIREKSMLDSNFGRSAVSK